MPSLYGDVVLSRVKTKITDKSATVIFIGRVTDDNPDPLRIPGLPNYGDSHPIYPRLKVNSIDCEQEDKWTDQWRVTVSYGINSKKSSDFDVDGTEIIDYSVQSGTERIFYALDLPVVLFEDVKNSVTNTTTIGYNPDTGDVGGIEIVTPSITFTIQQLRAGTTQYPIDDTFRNYCNTTVGKINADIFYGWPARCVMLIGVEIPSGTGQRSVTYNFYARPPVDLTDMVVTDYDGVQSSLTGVSGGFEVIDVVKSRRNSISDNKTIYYDSLVRKCRVYHTSNFTGFNLKNVFDTEDNAIIGDGPVLGDGQ